MHRKLLLATAALSMALAGPALAQDNTATPQPSDPNQSPQAMTTAASAQEFATMAAQSDMFEIESSQLALERAQDVPVREFAQQMVDDHTQSSQKLKQAAQAEGITDVPQTLNPQHQQMLSQLENTPDGQFDSEYARMQVMAHQQAVALYSSYAEQEGELADFAEATLPTLQQHLAHAEELSAGEPATGSVSPQ